MADVLSKWMKQIPEKKSNFLIAVRLGDFWYAKSTQGKDSLRAFLLPVFVYSLIAFYCQRLLFIDWRFEIMVKPWFVFCDTFYSMIKNFSYVPIPRFFIAVCHAAAMYFFRMFSLQISAAGNFNGGTFFSGRSLSGLLKWLFENPKSGWYAARTPAENFADQKSRLKKAVLLRTAFHKAIWIMLFLC